ncbi:carbohydrate sulfotransferase 14-like [Ciona intestinalis]
MRRMQKYFLLLCTVPVPILLCITYNPTFCCKEVETEPEKGWFFSRSMDSIALQLYVHKEADNDKRLSNISKSVVNMDSGVNHKAVRKSLTTMCDQRHDFPSTLNNLTKKQRHITLTHLIVNDKYKFLYCYTPKVACSNWKKVIKVLYGEVDSADKVHQLDHVHGFKYLSDYNTTEIQERLETYYKFMFVRNPVERALSVYRNKFNEIEAFHKLYGSKISSMYHQPEQYRGKVPGDDVTFVDFLKYISTGIDETDMNEHWMPMSTLCQPCAISYDFIGTYNNIEEEAEIVLRAINAPKSLHFPHRQPWYKPTSHNYIQHYFSLVQPSLFREFVEKYMIDFKMFSYPLPSNLTSVINHSVSKSHY